MAIISSPKTDFLTAHHDEVVQRINMGRTAQQIADAFPGISATTVRKYVYEHPELKELMINSGKAIVKKTRKGFGTHQKHTLRTGE